MKSIIITSFFGAALCAVVIGCDVFFTSVPEKGETFDQPLDGLTREQQLAFARGDAAFEKVFSFNEGLGPLFVQPSCESCHSGDGKGHPRTNLTRFQKNDGITADFLEQLGGPQLQQRSKPGTPPEEIPPQANAVSVRSGPPVFGMGLIEAIPDSTILSRSDPNDADGDGISGRPNFVSAPSWITALAGPYQNGTYLGRFGRKAGTAFLIQQVAMAYLQDIGVTSEYLPQENPHPSTGLLNDDVPDPEISAATVNDVAEYLRTLAPPKRGQQTSQVLRGQQIFSQIGCARCHVPSMKTGRHPTIAALSEIEVYLYSDLLLHDMGDELADNFIEGEANRREWRTTPLWGLRLYAEHLGGTPYYLHDGRTSDLSEAIRLHGGEAASARNQFLQLSQEDKQALLAFLRSL